MTATREKHDKHVLYVYVLVMYACTVCRVRIITLQSHTLMKQRVQKVNHRSLFTTSTSHLISKFKVERSGIMTPSGRARLVGMTIRAHAPREGWQQSHGNQCPYNPNNDVTGPRGIYAKSDSNPVWFTTWAGTADELWGHVHRWRCPCVSCWKLHWERCTVRNRMQTDSNVLLICSRRTAWVQKNISIQDSPSGWFFAAFNNHTNTPTLLLNNKNTVVGDCFGLMWRSQYPIQNVKSMIRQLGRLDEFPRASSDVPLSLLRWNVWIFSLCLSCVLLSAMAIKGQKHLLPCTVPSISLHANRYQSSRAQLLSPLTFYTFSVMLAWTTTVTRLRTTCRLRRHRMMW